MIRVFGDDWNSFATASVKNLGDIIRELIRFVIIVVELKIAVVETLGILQIIDMIFDSEHNITHIQVFNYNKQKINHTKQISQFTNCPTIIIDNTNNKQNRKFRDETKIGKQKKQRIFCVFFVVAE